MRQPSTPETPSSGEALKTPQAPAVEANKPQAQKDAAHEESNTIPAAPTQADVSESGQRAKDPDREAAEAKHSNETPSRQVADQVADTTDTAAPVAVQQQAKAAVAVAEQLTALDTPELKEMAGAPSNDTTSPPPKDHEGATPEDPLVALVAAPADTKSVSELAGKAVAIDKRHSGAEPQVRPALVAAGAEEVRLTDSETPALDRLVRGEVSGAILALVSPDAADAFPTLAGFSVFKVPLSPRAMKGETAAP